MSAACTTEPNAADGATYTCTSAENSDVSACKDGFWEDETGTADVCTGASAEGKRYPSNTHDVLTNAKPGIEFRP